MNNFQIKLVNIDRPVYLIINLYFQPGVQLLKWKSREEQENSSLEEKRGVYQHRNPNLSSLDKLPLICQSLAQGKQRGLRPVCKVYFIQDAAHVLGNGPFVDEKRIGNFLVWIERS